MRLFLVLVLLLTLTPIANAYFKEYPPYTFKEGPFKPLNVPVLVDYDHPNYQSPNGQISIKLKETDDSFDFEIKEGKNVLVRKNDQEPPYPFKVYHIDLDKNGLEDFIILYSYRTMGFSQSCEGVGLLLQKEKGKYQSITYDASYVGMEDFVDLNNDGKYKVIIGGLYGGKKHNYVTYDIYEFKDYRLVNADKKYKSFPKFIWLTDKPNDKNTIHLTEKEKEEHIINKDRSIQYKDISRGKNEISH